MLTVFEDDIKRRKVILDKYNRAANFMGIFKLILLVIICYGSYSAYKNKYPIRLLTLIGIEVVIYIIAHIFHRKTFAKINLEEGHIAINEKNIKRITGEWCSFEDIGEEFIDNNHPYSIDLDIVGKKSVFQMLNSSHTYYGRKLFAKDLLNPQFSQNEIKERQDSITELRDKYSWASYMEYLFSVVGIDDSFPALVEELQDKKHFIENKFVKIFLKLLWIPTCSLLVYSILFKYLIAFNIACGLLILHIILCIIGFNRARNYVGVMRKLPKKLFRYDKIIKEIIDTDFESIKLEKIKDIIKSSQVALNELYAIANNVSQCKNGIAYIILNLLFLLDYKNAINLDNWKQKHSESVDKWFTALGELESLISFSNLPRVCNNVYIPKLNERKNCIRAIDLGHPLINNDKRVCNDFVLDNNIYIISGSNMSGKTTFMRTVGINMVLAQAGSYVCASNMSFSKMNVITSMRVFDDLNEGISTFYAELKRIKMIIDKANSNKNTLFLIDEIFRGTNSIDRLKGAEGVLKELSKLGVAGMITTHDLEVCRLEDNYQGIANYSFSENYINDEIYFDYKLKHGKSKTTNAEYLLKKVGIIS